MRRAYPDESPMEQAPVMMANLSSAQFSQFFPVEMTEIDQFAEAEPSIGGMIQLNSGLYFTAIYGKISGMLTILIPPDEEQGRAIERIFEEVPLKPHVWWRRDEGLIHSQF